MNVADMVSQLEYQLGGMSNEDGDFKVYALDVGEIFIKARSGEVFILSVNKASADAVEFIDEDDWS